MMNCDDCTRNKNDRDCPFFCQFNPQNKNYFKPKHQVIDLSCMVGSDIDCEFSNGTIDRYWYIEKLSAIGVPNNKLYCDRNESFFHKCRIRQDHWHSWQGGECPLPEGLIIEYLTFTDVMIPHTNINDYKTLGWHDIYAFKVLGPADGWYYEWEENE